MLYQAKVIDIFAGVGGLTNGLKKAGLDVVAGYDIDTNCVFPYEYNNETPLIIKDVKKVTKSELNKIYKSNKTEIKILVGCAPCQPFSNHQKRKNEKSKHKDFGLINEFLRLIKEVEPEVVSMENVPQILQEEIFDNFVKTLEENKYFIEYKVINVKEYGVAQSRRRLVLIASKLGEINIIPETHKNSNVSVKEIIGKLPAIESGQSCKNDNLHKSSKLSDLNIKRIRSSKPGGTWREWDKSLLPDCYKKESGQTYSSVYGRLDPDKPSGTLTTQFYSYGTGRYGHYSQDRALSLREGALLQSFPEEYKFIDDKGEVKITHVARMIGNAVPPRLGEVIGLSIIEHLKDYVEESE